MTNPLNGWVDPSTLGAVEQGLLQSGSGGLLGGGSGTGTSVNPFAGAQTAMWVAGGVGVAVLALLVLSAAKNSGGVREVVTRVRGKYGV